MFSETRTVPRANALACLLIGTLSAGAAFANDPMASNNGLYPDATAYDGPFLPASLDYPQKAESNPWQTGQFGPLTVDTAEKYALALKDWLEPDFRTLIDDSRNWDPAAAGWYDMVWSGGPTPGADGKTDPTSGRDAIMNTYTGQILPPETWPVQNHPTVPVQNHAVIYYDSTAATMLGKLWGDLYKPDLSALGFPEGSVVVKAEAITPTAAEWPVVQGASKWNVFRASVANEGKGIMTPEVLSVSPFQMSIKVKDRMSSPQTGWVYLGFVYDATAPGKTAWDRFIPLGVMWGNDPEFANDPNGLPPGKTLTETWINPAAPDFTHDTLGWGDRLAGPMDVATRHNVLTPSGKRYQGDDRVRASSCMSCHSSAEFPFTTNLYPSPNKSFPPDGEPFLLYDPGSKEWARWFQNRDGATPISNNIGGIALDYDMVLMFALSAWSGATGNMAFVQERFNVH